MGDRRSALGAWRRAMADRRRAMGRWATGGAPEALGERQARSATALSWALVLPDLRDSRLTPSSSAAGSAGSVGAVPNRTRREDRCDERLGDVGWQRLA